MLRLGRIVAGAMVLLFLGGAGASSAGEMDDCTSGTGESAVRACTTLIGSNTLRGMDLALALSSRALAYVRTGQARKALADYTEAIRLQPDNALNYRGRANAYFRLREFGPVFADIDDALRLDPSDAEAYFIRAVTYRMQRKYDRAVADYSHMIRLDRDHASAYLGRCISYYNMREFENAVADCTRSIALRPSHPGGYGARGTAYYFNGDYDRALADYEKALEIKPDYRQASTSIGAVYNRQGEPERALARLNRIITRHRDWWRAYSHRGDAYNLMGDYGRALADLNQAIENQPGYVHSYTRRGFAYMRTGEFDLAITDYTHAVESDPGLAEAYGGRAEVYVLTGELRRAFADIQKASELDPDYARRADEILALMTGAQSATVKPGETQPQPLAANLGRRVALVIGNSVYEHAPRLRNPERDARAVAEALRAVGFADVTLKLDLGRDALIDALITFSDAAATAEWAVIYYAGHGIELGGANYLVPVDAELKRDAHVRFQAVHLDDVLGAMSGAKTLKLAILDACRDNPFANTMEVAGTRSLGRGLGLVEPDAGTLVAYAARDGQLAQDGDGDHSPYVTALLEHMTTTGLEINLLFRRVRDTVARLTQRAQEPYVYGSLPAQELYFAPAAQ